MNQELADLYARFPQLEPVATPVYDQVVRDCGVDPLMPARPSPSNPWVGLYAVPEFTLGTQVRRVGMLFRPAVAHAESVISESLPRGQFFRFDAVVDGVMQGRVRRAAHGEPPPDRVVGGKNIAVALRANEVTR